MAERSPAEEKSRSSRLIKTFNVWGADEEFDVRIRIECSLTWPVKLSMVLGKPAQGIR